MRGHAAVTHATGYHWLSLSQSLICPEQANWLALINRQRRIEHRIRLRGWCEFDRQRRIEQKRIANEARWLTVYKVYLLTPGQLNRATGETVWPESLQSAEYSSPRQRLDELFRQRAGYIDSPIGSEVELQTCVKSLARTLRRNIGVIERND